jgi:hypothetical protein
MRTIATFFCLAAVVAAQAAPSPFAFTATPNPAPIGATFNITITGVPTTTAQYFSGGCLYSSIHKDHPTGPIVWVPFVCTANLPPTGPCQTLTTQWPQLDSANVQVPSGVYYLEFRAFTATGTPVTSWLPLTILGPNVTAVLSQTQPPIPGLGWALDISAPNAPFGPYVAVASLSTDVGFPSGLLNGVTHVALDQDFLFGLSFPNPSPLLFQNFNGGLDVNGNTPASLIMNIPNDPAISCYGLAVQAAVLGANGVELTNPISATIP